MNDLLIEKIHELEREIYNCNFDNVINEIINIIQEIECKKLLVTSQNKWSKIMNYLLANLENKDYLIIADVLKFELVPLLKV